MFHFAPKYKISILTLNKGIKNVKKNLSAELTKFLSALTGQNWVLDIQKSGGAPTEAEKKEQKSVAVLENLKKQDDVSAILKQFPGAKIDKIKPIHTDIELSPEHEEED